MFAAGFRLERRAVERHDARVGGVEPGTVRGEVDLHGDLRGRFLAVVNRVDRPGPCVQGLLRRRRCDDGLVRCHGREVRAVEGDRVGRDVRRDSVRVRRDELEARHLRSRAVDHDRGGRRVEVERLRRVRRRVAAEANAARTSAAARAATGRPSGRSARAGARLHVVDRALAVAPACRRDACDEGGGEHRVMCRG